jgi:hypothetical protein
MISKHQIYLFISLLFAVSTLQAYSQLESRHPFYLGLGTGYGSTAWGQLVPSKSNSILAMNMSTPTKVKEGGAIFNLFMGYELMPAFALEAAYTKYADAKISFDETSLFSFYNNDATSFTTETESVSLLAKFMLLLPSTNIRPFSSAGVAGIHRYDMMRNRWRASPTFGLGFNYPVTNNILTELGVNYTGGYGESELDPSKDYVPFLYSAFFRLAYRF